MAVSVVSPQSFAERISRIIGGTTADRIEWPWMAGLVYNSSNNDEVFCGASLIAEHWVLTAAHCVVDGATGKKASPSSIKVLLGTSDFFAINL